MYVFIVCLFIIAFTQNSIEAKIVSTSGAVVNFSASPPASVDNNADTSSTIITSFDESLNVTTPAGVMVQLLSPVVGNLYDSRSEFSPLVPLPSGIQVDSHYINFDNVPTVPDTRLTGTIGFDGDILAVIVNDFPPTNGTFGRAGVIYGTGPLFTASIMSAGLELIGDPFVPGTEDNFTLTTSKELSLSFANGGAPDQIRVLTQSVPIPEPRTYLLIGSALACIFLLKLLKKRKGYS